MKKSSLKPRALIWAMCAIIFLHFGHPPFSYWPLYFVGSIFFLQALISTRTCLGALLVCFFVRTIFCMSGTFYLIGAHPAVLLFCSINHGLIWLPMGIGFYYSRKWFNVKNALLLIPILWTFCDWIVPYTHFFPSTIPCWAVTLANSPFIQLAPFIGFFGFSYLGASLAILPIIIKIEYRGIFSFKNVPVLCLYLSMIMLIIISFFKYSPYYPPAMPSSKLNVALVSISPLKGTFEDRFNKKPWNAITKDELYNYASERMKEIKLQIKNKSNVDLVILPEDTIDVIIPTDMPDSIKLNAGIENNATLLAVYSEFASSLNASVVVGMTTIRNGKRYNSAIHISNKGKILNIIDKIHLTIGSEYWPYADLFPYYKIFNISANSTLASLNAQYFPGNKYQPLHLINQQYSIATSICVEAQSPNTFQRLAKQGTKLVAVLSNNHWFRLDPLPYNKQILATLKAETAAYGLPVLLTGKESFVGLIESNGEDDVNNGFGAHYDIGVRRIEIPLNNPSHTFANQYGEYFPLINFVNSYVLAIIFQMAAVGRHKKLLHR